jgi:hypothetical protein
MEVKKEIMYRNNSGSFSEKASSGGADTFLALTNRRAGNFTLGLFKFILSGRSR